VHPEYETEALGDGLSNNSLSAEQTPMNPGYLPAPVPRRPNSQRPSVYEYQSEAGDYYRDTNAVQDPRRGPPSRPSSRAVSDYNRATANPRHSAYRNPSQERLSVGIPGNQFLPDPRLTVNSAIMNRSMSPALSMGGLSQPAFNTLRPTSNFSMATTFFTGPSNNPNPSDDELYEGLRTYLSTQDLMTVTKKYACSFVLLAHR
jgi:chitin synthase